MTIKRNAIAGVTVQQHQVTMALLTEPLRAPKMIYDAGVTQQPLAANVVEQGVWRDPHAVQVAIGRCQEVLGGSIRRVVMCLADDAVVTARVPSPERVFAHQQQAALKETAVQISPWPPEHSVVDWVTCSDGFVSLAVCRKQAVKEAKRCFANLNMRLLGIEPESQCHLRLLDWLTPKLDSRPGIFVIAEYARIGISLFVHGGLIGSYNNVASEGNPVHTQRTVLEDLTTAMHQSQLLQSPKPVVLAVGALVSPVLCSMLNERLGCEVVDLRIALSAAGLDYESKPPELADSSDGVVAVGNALWRFNG